MIVIPEILDHIAVYLDANSLLVCVSVCRQWKDLFTPNLWRTVDPSASPYNQIFECGGDKLQRQRWSSTLLRKHKQHIRNLTVVNSGQLLASLNNNLTELHSLTLRHGDNERQYIEKKYGLKESVSVWNKDDKDMFSSALNICPKEEVIPNGVFVQSNSRADALTRASWLLVRNNPNLRRIVFDETWDTLSFRNKWNPVTSSDIMHHKSVTFLTKALSRQRSLQHIELGCDADDYLLANLATIPSLKSFVHSEYPVKFHPQVLRLQPPHCALKRLVFIECISSKQLRSLAVAFPALNYLSAQNIFECEEDVNNHTGNKYSNGAEKAEVLEWNSLKAFNISGQTNDFRGILQAQVRFPRITRFNRNLSLGGCMIPLVLWTFPGLQTLVAHTGNSPIFSLTDEEEELYCREGDAYPVQNLIIDELKFRSTGPKPVLACMTSLVVLKVYSGLLEGSVLTSITKTLRNLQHLWFDLQAGCSREMMNLLVECPATLKICRGYGHRVLAEDLIGSAEWACGGLEELDIEIVGIPRLSKADEKLLEDLWKRDLSLSSAMMMTVEVNSAEEENAMRQIRKKMRQLGHELTDDETRALGLQQSSYSIQRKVYQRLGRLTQLQEIAFNKGRRNNYTWEGEEGALGTLEFTLESGLGELAGLMHLKKLDIARVGQRIGKTDQAWMLKQWPLLKGDWLD
ncbi:hypothetical protein BGZ95_001182 [Linnemannia exigua]|uniref:F-box domain-containing protein n=1 Tax=Linnemannia exigua TaxID=604196 RepID=A0AAD4H549_9FUNG|nr:hypothetical protein BGZ95_001182 [Linnemannia exigua]